ncbi:MAG: hypothetical protein Q4B08_04070 [Propionibacteriaceae bacterium]|nr:hypothetical protein [Propionibacteriaceae bacterium]
MTWLDLSTSIALFGLCGAIASLCGIVFVERMFRLVDSRGAQGPAVIAAGTRLRGGAWIGALERIAVFVCLVAGFPAGIAMVIAMKGLARYPELKVSSTGAAERFIIGTFLSMLFAAAWAGIAVWLRGMLP